MAIKKQKSTGLPHQPLERLNTGIPADPSLVCKVPVLVAVDFDALEDGDPLLDFAVEDVPPIPAVVTAVKPEGSETGISV